MNKTKRGTKSIYDSKLGIVSGGKALVVSAATASAFFVAAGALTYSSASFALSCPIGEYDSGEGCLPDSNYIPPTTITSSQAPRVSGGQSGVAGAAAHITSRIIQARQEGTNEGGLSSGDKTFEDRIP